MAINLYIMRHGDAQAYASNDAARQLTPRGREEVKRNALYLKQSITGFDLVLVSPYVRARQTQQIVCDILQATSRVDILDDLVPEGDAAKVHDYLDAAIELYHPKTILLVSHMPLVSYLVEALSMEQTSPIFPTAGLAHIDYDAQLMKGYFTGIKAPS